MIETAPWGEDSQAIENQIISHNKFHTSIQRSQEVNRAMEEVVSYLDLFFVHTRHVKCVHELAERRFF